MAERERAFAFGIASTDWHGDEDGMGDRLREPPTSEFTAVNEVNAALSGRTSFQPRSASLKTFALARGI